MKDSPGLRFLYGTLPGRVLLRPLVSPCVSRLGGAFLSTRLSALLINGFIRRNNIDMSDYAQRKYESFNDFFTRELADGARQIDTDPRALIAPCDGRLSVYSMARGRRIKVKSLMYSLDELLGGTSPLAWRFEDGLALVFRLCVDDYHRYCFFDGGASGDGGKIKGALHTVRPAALENRRVFAQNSREFRALNTDNFGEAIQIEVGALMVGKIRNERAPKRFERGQAKGMFEFGGSTVILLLQKGRALLRADLLAALDTDCEIKVRLGEKIGTAGGEKTHD